MTNVEKLKKINPSILSDIRHRLGASNETDTSKDDLINELNNKELVAAYCGWHLGYSQWWDNFIQLYESLQSYQTITDVVKENMNHFEYDYISRTTIDLYTEKKRRNEIEEALKIKDAVKNFCPLIDVKIQEAEQSIVIEIDRVLK